jgi:hypothetical protein
MAMLPLIAPVTAEVVAPNYVTFETNGYDTVTLVAAGLAGAEEVDIFVSDGTGWATYGDGSAAITLTATLPAVSLPAGPRYAVLKDATAGAAGVSVWLGVGGAV